MQPLSDPLQVRLSVVVVVGDLHHRARRAVEGVLAQESLDQLELIIVDLAADRSTWEGADSRVRIHRMPPSTLLSQARAAAVQLAKAPLVAFLEEHTVPEPSWATEIIAADDGDWAAAGTAIRHGNPGSAQSDASYQVSYGLFEPPVVGGETTVLPGHNSVYRREVLLDLGPNLPELLAIDNVLHEVLRRAGRRLVLLGSGTVHHWNETTVLATARGHWWFHRSFGARRARYLDWNASRRVAYVVLTPLIPVYAILLWVRRRLGEGRPTLGPLLDLGPRMVLIHIVSAVAQAVGLVFGEGRAQTNFTSFELGELARADAPVSPGRPD